MNEDRQNLILVFLALFVAIALLVIPNNDIPKTYTESHIVKQGETLSEIVEEYGGNLKKTQALIPNPNVIMPGQKISVVIEGR
jgi:LysM repeat protein